MVTSKLLIILGVAALAIAGVTVIILALTRGTRRCSECSHVNEPGAKFCARCGKPV
jgi:rRNA maturation endonuclease Nob1